MSYGSVVHEDVQARARRRQEQLDAGRRCGRKIEASRAWCVEYVPESVQHGVNGEPHVAFVSAALVLRSSLGRRPTPAEVVARVELRWSWALDRGGAV
jgi:hypothetical protein